MYADVFLSQFREGELEEEQIFVDEMFLSQSECLLIRFIMLEKVLSC